MNGNMILVMRDELGDEVVVERYTLRGLLDEDELELWQDRKIRQAEERFPEAQGFYWEDRRGWDSLINQMLHG